MTGETWQTISLGEICTMKYGKMPRKEHLTEEGYPVFTGYLIAGFYKDYLYEDSEIVVVARGIGGAGDIRMSPPRSWITNISIILQLQRPDIDKRFLFYRLLSASLRSLRTGAAQPQIIIADLKSYKIEIPPFPAQRKIAAILSAYDDLIENNLRRIEILEEMAQLVYREWFVKFRFPGHENVRMVDSRMGPIPGGWDVVRTEDLVKRIASGKKYEQRTVSAVGAVPVLDQGRSGIIGYHDDEPGVRASEEQPVVVFANHTCYQRIIQYPFSAIQNVLPFVANPERCRNIYWLHWATKDLVEFNDYKGHWPEFMTKKLVCPPANHTEEFGQVVNPIVRLTYKLEIQNQILQRTRDLLLPKLISGELDVESLDIDIGEEPA